LLTLLSLLLSHLNHDDDDDDDDEGLFSGHGVCAVVDSAVQIEFSLSVTQDS